MGYLLPLNNYPFIDGWYPFLFTHTNYDTLRDSLMPLGVFCVQMAIFSGPIERYRGARVSLGSKDVLAGSEA